ncbi:MAG: hypothetical protein K6E94_02085, partial [Elusimicrobiaceae bacterium]|nr:hypothetical protein [Elusimicrobiaceae bacterium]
MKNQKVIIAVLSCLISMPGFAEGFNVNKEISSSVKEAVLDSAFSMPQKKSKKPTAFSRYKAMEFSIREGKMSELKKILKEGALPDLIKWYDKNGQEKVAAYDRDIYPEKYKWFALKPYETLFVTATLVRNKKA